MSDDYKGSARISRAKEVVKPNTKNVTSGSAALKPPTKLDNPHSEVPLRNNHNTNPTANPTTNMNASAAKSLEDHDCTFCDIIRDVKNAVTHVFHNDSWDSKFLVMQPIDPVTEGHVLVIPRMHVKDASSAEVFGATCACASHVAQTLYKDTAVHIQGRLGDQSVPHLLVHVIPRRKDDGLKQPWTDQKPGHFNTKGQPPIPENMKPKKPMSKPVATVAPKPAAAAATKRQVVDIH